MKRIVLPSLGLAEELKREYPFAAEKIVVLPNPVELERMKVPADFDRPAFRSAHGIGTDDVVLVFVALGHFERKGLPQVLDAMASMKSPRLKLCVVGGEQGLIAGYQEKCQGIGIADQVVFAGMQKDVRPFLWSADAFVLPSFYETFSLGTFEAAAAGLPVLVSHLYGVNEFLVDGKNGYLIDTTAEGVRTGLQRLLASRRRNARASEPRPLRAYDRTGLMHFSTAGRKSMQLDYARPRRRRKGIGFPMWAVLVGGYTCFGRDFAYLGIAPLFIGEAYLGYSILRNLRNWTGRFLNDCFRLKMLPLAIMMHMMWGITEVIRASLLGRSLLQAIRTAAFNYYPLFLLIGIAVGWSLTLPYLLRVLKYIIVIFGFRAIGTMLGMDWMSPANCAIAAVFTIAIWNELKGWKLRVPFLVLALIPVFFTGLHGRGTVLGLVAGVVAVAASSWKRLMQSIVIGIGGTMLMFVVGPLIPGPNGGAPPLDPVVQVARSSWRPVNRILQFASSSGGRADASPGVTGESWTIFSMPAERQCGVSPSGEMPSMSSRPPSLRLLGKGEAVSIADLTPDGADIHTPHNITIYCIYYTGYIGLAIFFLMLAAIWYRGTQLNFRTLRTLYSASFWCTLLVAVTGNFLEAPFGAIPFYLLQGVLIGLDQKMTAEARYARRVQAEWEREEWAQAEAERIERLTPAARVQREAV